MLQASFAVGCESRGVEVVPERCRIADEYNEALHEIASGLNINNFGKVEFFNLLFVIKSTNKHFIIFYRLNFVRQVLLMKVIGNL